MHSDTIPDMRPQEKTGYFEVSRGAHLYTALHAVTNPVARVLLAGPFASERHNTYIPWIRWARYLALRRIEVLRFDYRAIGESTGDFDKTKFDDWEEDVRLLTGWLGRQSPSVPLVLHGFEFGALLTGIAFHAGMGDALLLWAPPASANTTLRSTLKRRIGLEQMFRGSSSKRNSVSDYVKQLEDGGTLDVDGYRWSPTLWRDSFNAQLPPTMTDKISAPSFYGKPVRIVELDKDPEPLAGVDATPNGDGDFNKIRTDLERACGKNFKWHHTFKFWCEFRPYFDWLFADNYTWINASLRLSEEKQ